MQVGMNEICYPPPDVDPRTQIGLKSNLVRIANYFLIFIATTVAVILFTSMMPM